MVTTQNILIEILENFKKCLYDENWKDNTLGVKIDFGHESVEML